MTKHITMPIKKRPLKAEIRFLLHEQPPVEVAQTNSPSHNGGSNGSNPTHGELTPTPTPPDIEPQPSPSRAPQQIPRNNQSAQPSENPVDGLTPAALTIPSRQPPGGKVILNEIHPNRPLRRRRSTGKSLARMPRHEPTPPGTSAQHSALSNYPPPAQLPCPTSHANPANIHRQQPKPPHSIVSNLHSQRTSGGKRNFCPDMGTSEIEPNRQRRRLRSRNINTTRSVRPVQPGTRMSDEVQPDPTRSHGPSLLTRMEEVRNDVRCDICDAPFFNIEAVERHKTSQHPKENGCERTGWECSICEAVLKNRQNLRRHERVHGKDAHLPCPRCNVLFTTERSRTSHMRDKHTVPTATRGPSKRSYTCSECNYASIQKTNVQRHVNSVHLKLRRYHCPFGDCSYRASTKANLEAHKMSYMHDPANDEDEEESDKAGEELNFIGEKDNYIGRRWKDDESSGGGGAGSGLPNALLPVH